MHHHSVITAVSRALHARGLDLVEIAFAAASTETHEAGAIVARSQDRPTERVSGTFSALMPSAIRTAAAILGDRAAAILGELPEPGADDWLVALQLEARPTEIVATVDSAHGHRFVGTDGADECVRCGALYELVADAPGHGCYVGGDGAQPIECPGPDASLVHGFASERFCTHCDSRDCEHTRHSCNCLHCA